MENELQQTLKIFRKNYPLWLTRLKDYVKIESTSLPEYHVSNLQKAAKFGLLLFKEAGLEKTRLITVKNAPPYIYGEFIKDKSLPTVLLYAHYDVQPSLRLEKWKSPPFRAKIINGRMYGRGTADDKGGIILHLACIHSYFEACGTLPINIKVLIEGEEEAGSPHLPELLKKHKKKLECDLIIIADSSNYDKGLPTLTTSLRGLVAVEVETKILKNPLHSGMWGGPIPDPITELSKIIAKLTDKDGKITIPELYDFPPLHEEEKQNLKKLPFSETKFRKQISMVPEGNLLGSSKDALKRLWYEPSLIVNSIESGNRKSAGNVLMDHAWCKIGIRTVLGMDSKKVLKYLKMKIQTLASKNIKLKITPVTLAEAWKTQTKHHYFTLAKKALHKAYKKKPVCIGCGGSIPFTYHLSLAFKNAPAILIGIEDPLTKAHSENESLNLKDFKNIIEAEIILLSYLKKDVSLK